MTGLELSRAYYEEYGKDMIHEEFSDIEDLLAVGLVGSGSECFGYDDEFSKDHDFEPAFCIFIPENERIDSKTEFKLERAYAKLPKEFMGYKKSLIGPVGGNRHGVIKTSEFYLSKCGNKDGELTIREWLTIPEFELLEAVNGEVFLDNLGEFSKIRDNLLYYPEDIRLKKLAGYLLKMNQSGQYNYERLIKRGDTAAAQLSIFEFVNAALHVIFLINRHYMPYYKWSFKALSNLEKLSNLYDSLEYLISSDNEEKNSMVKLEIIDDVIRMIIEELQNEEITKAICMDLEKHAHSVNDMVEDSYIRNLNIFVGV